MKQFNFNRGTYVAYFDNSGRLCAVDRIDQRRGTIWQRGTRPIDGRVIHRLVTMRLLDDAAPLFAAPEPAPNPQALPTPAEAKVLIVIRAAGDFGRTQFEIEDLLGGPYTSKWRSLVPRLVGKGLVLDAGIKRPRPDTGVRCTVWISANDDAHKARTEHLRQRFNAMAPGESYPGEGATLAPPEPPPTT